MSAQVNAADTQVVTGPDEAWLQLQGSRVGLHRLLAAVAIGQSGAQPVPQEVILGGQQVQVHRQAWDRSVAGAGHVSVRDLYAPLNAVIAI